MSQVEYEDVDEDKNKDEDDVDYVAIEDEPRDEDVDDHDDDDDSEDEDTRLGGGREDEDDDDDAADGKRARRRQERKERKAAQRKARERTERELKFLRNRNEQLERRFSEFEQTVDQRVANNELAGIDTQLNKAKSDLQLANQVIAKAAEDNNGADMAEALDHRDTIRDTIRDLEETKQYYSNNESRQPAREPRELDPRHAAYAQSFMMDHEWYDPRATDQDSRAVLMIDRALAGEGYDPKTKQYWDELRERVHEQLPHHFADDGDDDDADDTEERKPRGEAKEKRRGGGPKFRTGGRERPLKKNEVYISPERKEAMIEAGVWDDPVLRKRYLKSYAEFDKENAGA